MIPTSFLIYGQEIQVDMVADLGRKEAALGITRYRENLIQLQDDAPGYPIPYQQIEQTFYHELVHVILAAMHATELNDDENFVDTFSHLLHQAITTMEYDYDDLINDLEVDAANEDSDSDESPDVLLTVRDGRAA